MLNSQNVDLVFTRGVDNKTDSKNVLASDATILDNVRYDKIGAAIPRGGVVETALTSELASDSSVSFGAAGDGVDNLQMSRGSLYHDTASGVKVVGSELRGSVTRLPLGNSSARRVSAAKNGTTICTAWIDGTTLVAQLSELDGPIIAQASSNVAFTPNSIVCLYNNGEFYIILEGNQGGEKFIAYRFNNGTSFSSISGVTWTAPVVTSIVRWDACSDGTSIYLFYATGSGTSTTIVKLSSLASAFSQTASVAGPSFTTAAKGFACISPTGMTGVALVVTAAEDAGNAKIRFLSSALATVGSEQSVSSATRRPQVGSLLQISSTRVEAWFSGAISSGFSITHSGMTATSGSSAALSRPSGLDCLPLAQGMLLDNRRYQYMDTTTEPTYGSQALAEWLQTDNTLDLAYTLGVSKNVGNLDMTTEFTLPKVLVIGNKYVIPVCFVGSTTGLTAGAPADDTIVLAAEAEPQVQASLVVIDTDGYRPSIIDRSRGQSVLLAGSPRLFNTSRQVAGPWPEISMKLGANRLDINTAPSTPYTGTMSCVFAKVMRLTNGQEYRLYSPIYTANLSASAIRYTLLNSDFAVSGGGYGVVTAIEVYRTEQNGTIFYFSAQKDLAGTYTIDGTDTVLISGRLADINGDELYSEIASGAQAVIAWRDRIALVAADNPTVIKFDKPSNYPVGTSFAAGLEVDVGTQGGDIVALGSMDSALYIFKRNQIYTMYGDPPGATGAGGSLNTPLLFKNGLGCSSARSVIQTPKGLMFASDKGFYIILRNQEIASVVQGPYDDRAKDITGSAIDQDQSEVYFSYADGAIWVFNYELGTWYRWTPAPTAKGVCIVNGELVISTDVGFLTYSRLNTDDQLISGTVPIDTDFQSGWFRLSGIRGYQRVRRLYLLGRLLTNCTLTVDVLVDYKDTPVQTIVLTLNSSSIEDNPLQIDLHLARQKCEAIAFRIRADQYGVSLSGGTLEMGVKNGPDKSAVSGSNSKG